MLLRIFILNYFCFAVFQMALSNPAVGDTEQVYNKALYSKVLTYDPAQLTDTESLSVANQIYESLLELDEHNEVGPALAESWQTVDNGKKLVFQLRKNVKFHNGKEMDAEDCVSSFERVLRPDSKVFTYYSIIKGADEFRAGKAQHVTGLKAKSKYEFEIELKNAFPPFATVLTGATARILPKDASKNKNFFLKPIGTGPFQFGRGTDQEVILNKFRGYWREGAKLSEIHFKILDEKTGLDEASRGALHDLSAYPLNGDEPIFKKGKQVSVPVIATWLIGLNTKLAPFDNIQSRRSFIDSISSKDFVDRFYPGQEPAVGYIPPLLPGFIGEWTPQKILNNPPRDSITLYIPSVLEKAELIRQYFENNFKEKGFNVRPKLVSWDDFMKNYTKKSMQAFLFYMNADYPDTEFLARNFESTNEDNFTSVNSPALDQLIRNGRVTASRIERAKIYKKFAKTLLDQALTKNLMHYRAHYWVAPCVQGLNPSSLGDPYISYRTVYLEGSCNL